MAESDYAVTEPPASARRNASFASQFHWDTNEMEMRPSYMIPKFEPRWHPRITPYRFIMLATALGLGTAKALAVQSGSLNIPTTLEWVGGSVLSLLFFSVSGYDSGSQTDIPYYLEWLFLPDCMNLAWNLLSIFSVPRPSYISKETGSHYIHISYPQPPITLYRLLVCSTVVAFGISKAVFSYRNLSSAATWMDWAMAVPTFTILYCLGLYEYNSVDLWGPFFIADYSDVLFSVSTGVTYILSLIVCATWIGGVGYTTTLISYHPSLFDEIRTNDLIFYKLLAHELLVAGIIAGILTLLFTTRLVILSVTARGGLARRVVGVVRRPILRLMRRIMPLPTSRNIDVHSVYDRPSHRAHFTPSIDLAVYITIHICTYTFGIIVCSTIILTTFPLNPFHGYTIISKWAWDTFMMNAFLWSAHIAAILCYGAWFLGLSVYAVAMMIMMIEPFYRSRADVQALQGRLMGLGPFRHLL